MDIDFNKFIQDCMNEISERIRNLKRLNIIVVGKTGVGKSTLINSVFRDNLVETGIGKPVTTHMRKITKKDFPLCIYDTKGFELGKDAQKEVKQEIFDTISDGYKSDDINEAIHCIWYCINTGSSRIEPEEEAWLQEFTAENKNTRVPVIIVLTQTTSKKYGEKFQKYIENLNLNVKKVIPVLAQDYEIDDNITIPAFGLDTLITVMSEILPDELQDTLQNLQKVSLEEKKRHAHLAVATATTTAAATGAVPIPFSDCALLVPIQITMIASITAIFGLNISKSVLTGFISSVIGTGGATIAGKTLVSNLLKLIPGAGSVAGGAISGATAGLLTTALGEAYIKLMEAIYKGELKEEDLASAVGKQKMKEFYMAGLKSS